MTKSTQTGTCVCCNEEHGNTCDVINNCACDWILRLEMSTFVLYLKINNDWINTLIFTMSLISIHCLRIEYHSTLTTEDIYPGMAVQDFQERDLQFCRHPLKRTHRKLSDKYDDSDLLLII